MSSADYLELAIVLVATMIVLVKRAEHELAVFWITSALFSAFSVDLGFVYLGVLSFVLMTLVCAGMFFHLLTTGGVRGAIDRGPLISLKMIFSFFSAVIVSGLVFVGVHTFLGDNASQTTVVVAATNSLSFAEIVIEKNWVSIEILIMILAFSLIGLGAISRLEAE